MNLYFPIEGSADGGCSHSPPPLPNYMPLAPQMRHTFWANSQQSSWLGTSSSSLHQVSSSTWQVHHCSQCTWCKGEGSRLLGVDVCGSCLPPCCQLQMTPFHPGVPGGGAPVVEGTPNLPLLCLPLVLTSQPNCAAPSQPTRLAGATGRHCLFQHHFTDSPQMARGSSPQQRLPAAFAG